MINREKASAEPTKDFFVRMITRDISLEDCILDLLDNCVDGASRHIRQKDPDVRSFEGFSASIELSNNLFRITDNCGGISLDDAVNYAFRFGRRTDAPSDAEYGIGLYGIGMKRAIFKIGNSIQIETRTENDNFSVPIDVEQWRKKEGQWDFDIEEGLGDKEIGTTISITDLKAQIAEEFEDPVFENSLREVIARDYSFIIQDGFRVVINNKPVKAYLYKLRESEEFKPVRYSYKDNAVDVEIIAGLSGLPTEGVSPSEVEIKRTSYFGWFVSCNDRIVIAGSRGSDTVWGDDGFASWHPQYNGFMGIVRFKSEDPSLLPWTTTKREIEPQSPIYRRAISRMKQATRAFIDYSNARKEDIDTSRARETKTSLKNILQVSNRETMELPIVKVERVKKANITYSVDLEKARSAAKALGNSNMAYAQIGRRTFKYYYENEVED